MGKEGKVFLTDAFNFETFLSGGDNWTNFVDTGPGMENLVKSELAINEFDPTMRAVIDFGDADAFKALICPMGVAEFRAVIYYELVNLYMIITAIRHN
jgi:hypothetical protein